MAVDPLLAILGAANSGQATATPATMAPQPTDALLSTLGIAASSAVPNSGASMASSMAPNPTAGNSFGKNALIGIGSAFDDIGLRARQAYANVADLVSPAGPGGSRAAAVQREILEKRNTDRFLNDTAGGKVGGFVGKAIPAVAASLLPGGQSLGGSLLIGAGSGALEPTAGNDSTLTNTGFGALGGAAGYGVGRLIGSAASKTAATDAQRQILNSVKDKTASTARDLGYVIPPTQTAPGMLNSTLEGFAGKLSTGQSASVKNQTLTNSLAARALGLDPAQPITKDALAGLRQQASQAYQAVANIGEVTPGPAYTEALDKIVSPALTAAKSFPAAKPNPIIAEIDGLRTPTFDAASGLAKISELRAAADKAYAAGDKDLGRALRSGAGAIEDAIDVQLGAIPGAESQLSDFRNARQLIAKTYSVESALNDATGNVAARKLGSQLTRGRPLSGDLKTVAQFAQAFPKAADVMTSSVPGVSPLDFLGAGALSHTIGGAASLLSLGARPAVRSLILSPAYQRAMAAQSYGPGALVSGLASAPMRDALQIGGTLLPQYLLNDKNNLSPP